MAPTSLAILRSLEASSAENRTIERLLGPLLVLSGLQVGSCGLSGLLGERDLVFRKRTGPTQRQDRHQSPLPTERNEEDRLELDDTDSGLELNRIIRDLPQSAPLAPSSLPDHPFAELEPIGERGLGRERVAGLERQHAVALHVDRTQRSSEVSA